uniref:Sucrose-phosphatase n=1 Tax=Klebsormidium flaccidum TaxID=3175 RepID=G1UJV3_KLEFL|nr:sucrose phosphate phosphatase [Klebsormidium flaccidum]
MAPGADRADTASGKVSPRLMLVSDLDNTMVDHHDANNERLASFNKLWESEFSHDSLLVFSTGRSPVLYEQLRTEKPLLTPGIAITSVGTEIVYGDTLQADKGWKEILDQGWNRSKVLELTKKYPTLKLQADTEQRPHKISFHVEKNEAQKIVPELTAAFEQEKLAAKIIYSGGYDLDILSKAAGKGQALAYLLKKFKSQGHPPKNVLVCGDSGNDIELYEVEGVNGVIVGNAMEELVAWYDSQGDKGHVFRATQRCAAGIVEAIKHFKFDSSS